MIHQEELELYLSLKSVRPNGSQHLTESQLERVTELFLSDNCSLKDKAILLTLLIACNKSSSEDSYVTQLKRDYSRLLPTELHPFFETSTVGVQNAINLLGAGDKMSSEQFEEAIVNLFDEPKDYLKEAFVQVLSVRGTSLIEEGIIYDVFASKVQYKDVDLEQLITIGDHFDGCDNYPPLNLYIAAILGSIGYHCLVYGTVNENEDNSGVSNGQILLKSGGLAPFDLDSISEKLLDPDVAWGFIDQKEFAPEISALRNSCLRTWKTSVFANIETVFQPIKAKKNFAISQYTYSNDKESLISLIQKYQTFEKALLVNGIEGSCMINPTSPSESVLFENGGKRDVRIYGVQLGFEQLPKFIDDLSMEDAITLGGLVLDGESVPVREFIKFQCVYILHYVFGVPIKDALYDVKQSIDSGIAKGNWGRFFSSY